jgi:hypothetical protein
MFSSDRPVVAQRAECSGDSECRDAERDGLAVDASCCHDGWPGISGSRGNGGASLGGNGTADPHSVFAAAQP